ncbi:Pre-rRNA-processing protein IPI3 OS=Ustilago maydis (strain 521 / FGSC 9021) GN=IPI3 PE=3 SV=1 [Rhizoctonia solani AG-1 IB]|uniref:Pre-rRNA-processing protein IPI3 n=1 Tax=Thanatephorus cucumeris (strain AG1-IB / isolate 7/3/14) TaxID=1108050 RepID=A0A0B7FZX6_THACB|nr:Pre-rRNA-processing protein IPI3 OS=Ustilago maydis (strain 521 / FGSC 9021) GN=IPI3 PE=3 SV=1 [Rhizoctonia solani AG-1 IB]
MKLQETLLCALGPLSGSNAGHLALHDLKTGTSLATYKQNTSAVHNVSVVESQSGQGGYIISSQADKPILNVYHFQKDQLAQRIVLPERVTCVASDNRGNYCATGTANGRIYLWEVASGVMLNSWEAHFRRIHVLKFTTDDAAIVSASDDSGVSVWSVASLIDNQLQHELPVPYCNLSDHTLPVLDVVCGSGLFPDCRLVTCSQDHSVKIWDLSNPSRPLIGTFTFSYAIQMVTMDRAQRVIFAASAAGHIHRINLFKADGNSRSVQAVSGDTRLSEAEITVGQSITSLCISFTSIYLLVGTTSGAILVYDLESHQLLRSIATHKDKGLAIIYLQCMLKPVDHDTREKDPIPLRPVVPFQRTRDLKAREAHQVMVMISPRVQEPYANSDYGELFAGQTYFLNPQSQSRRGVSGSNTRVTELEEEVAQLRAALGQAKGINDSMWETMVHTLIPKSNPTPNGSTGADYMAVDSNSTGRKRARKTD